MCIRDSVWTARLATLAAFASALRLPCLNATGNATMAMVVVLMCAALALWVMLTFNRLVRLRNQSRTAWADIDAVSYTHLDVYKRQAPTRPAAHCAHCSGARSHRFCSPFRSSYLPPRYGLSLIHI